MIETGTVSLSQVEAEFPYLDDWFVNHPTAQVLDGKRLLSAEEKVQLQGGNKQIGKRAQKANTGIRDYMILTACRLDPMVDREIMNFTALLQYWLNTQDLDQNLKKLVVEGALITKEGLTYISKQADGSYQITPSKNGYFLTPAGANRLIV